MELKDTVEMMLSSDYKERFKAEYWQTRIRYEKLNNMCDKWDKGELNFEPTCRRALYDWQLSTIEEYLSILEHRAIEEEIELDIKTSNNVEIHDDTCYGNLFDGV